MITKHRLLLALALSATLASGASQAAGLMDSLSSAAGELSKSGGDSSGGMSLSSLTGLLNGGDKALSSSSMTNAAGILQYCVKNNVLSANGAEGVKEPGSEQPGHLADHREGEAKSLRSGAETGQILYFMMSERRSAPPFFFA